MPPVNRAPKVVRLNRRNNAPDQNLAHHGYFYSWKLNTLIPYRGLLAFDFLTITEADQRVISIGSASESVFWNNGQSWEEYCSRYTVTRRTPVQGVTRILEIEVLNSTDYIENWATYARIQRSFEEEGRKLLFFTEKQIRIEPRLTNSKLILTQAGDGICKEEHRNLIRQVAKGTQTFSLNELVDIGVLTYAHAYTAALNLVAAGELIIPMDRVFDGDTPIKRRG